MQSNLPTQFCVFSDSGNEDIKQLDALLPDFSLVDFNQYISAIENPLPIPMSNIGISLLKCNKDLTEEIRWFFCLQVQSGIEDILIVLDYQKDEIESNKLQKKTEEINAYVTELSKALERDIVSTVIPISTTQNLNIVPQEKPFSGYDGQSLIEFLQNNVQSAENVDDRLRFIVTERDKKSDFYYGNILSGELKKNDEVKIFPSGKQCRIKEVSLDDQSASILLENEIFLSSGEIVAAAKAPPQIADQFETTIMWLDNDPMLPGRSYIFKNAAQGGYATVTDSKHKINVESLAEEPAKKLGRFEMGVCNIAVDQKIIFDPIDEGRQLSSFVLIDRQSRNVVGIGFIHFALRRSTNIHLQNLDISKEIRSDMKGQKPVVLWFTGLSGSGKSTIANILEKKLTALEKHTYTLDGDNIRHGLNKDLGFTDADRVENIRRITQVAKLMADAGLIVLTSFISPFRSERQMARKEFEDGEFLEIYVDTPLEIAEDRDVKGLYKKARRGEIKNFTGIDSPYEPPKNAEIRVNTAELSAEQSAEEILITLNERGII